MDTKISAEEFLAQYAAAAGETVEAMEARVVVVPCDCDYEGCRGWIMRNRRRGAPA